MAANKRKIKSGEGSSPYNWPRVAHRVVDGFIELVNNNKIYPAFGLLLLIIATIIVVRIPQSDLAEVIKTGLTALSLTTPGLLFALIFSNLGWFYLLRRMKSIYGDEIDRLAAQRKVLMHGPSTKIQNHRSSEGECSESYLIPNGDKAGEKDSEHTEKK